MNEKQTRSSVGEIVAREEKDAHGRGAKSTIKTHEGSAKKAVAEKSGRIINNRDRGRHIPVMTELETAKFHAAVASCGKDECWPWKLYLRDNEYGQFMLNRKPFLAHRIAYFLAFGDFDASKSVCHRCDNRMCCNPAHLFLGTHADNARDMYQKRRAGCQLRPERLARGNRHGCAKLKESDIPTIRRMCQEGIYQRVIAKQYGVSQSQITVINTGKTWKHV
jgi:hypothetical protein